MPKRTSSTPDDLRASISAMRELLVSSVTLTTDRLQDAVEDAVRRGRMTRHDAEELLATLITTGRQQTEALLADLERLVGRRVKTDAASAPRSRSAFPIPGYDDLTAAEVNKRLKDLTPAQLRKVRDRERHGAARKSVLAAVERRLK
jgi:polyhydroxyalkanoate synthesis regulator phasin